MCRGRVWDAGAKWGVKKRDVDLREANRYLCL
jgi:hypothetical protein